MKAEDLYVDHYPGEWFPGYTKQDMKVIDMFTPDDVAPTPGFVTDFMGCKTRTSILYNEARQYDNQVWTPPIPGALFETAEWVGLLKAVLTATDTFAAMELGAGWGPVIVACAHAARMRGISNIFLCGVEADPGRFALMEQHLTDNGLNLADHDLIMAGVGSQGGRARWPRIQDPQNAGGARPVRAGNISDETYEPLAGDAIEVEIVPFCDLLRRRSKWDLVHIDVQGWELELCQSARHDLNARAKWLVIGTHSRKLDGDIIDLMHREAWVLENEKPSVFRYDLTQANLERMTIIDGIQVWRNPRLTQRMPPGC